MKSAIAAFLLKTALKLDDNVIFRAFTAPSINIITVFEKGTNIKQRFGYNDGDDAKCLSGLTTLMGHNPLEVLLSLMEDGHVLEGAKAAAISVTDNEGFVDGKKVWQKGEDEE